MGIGVEQPDGKRFVIKRNDLITLKLFVEFYLPEYQDMLNTLRQGPYPLKSLGELSTRMFDGPFGSNRKVDMYQESGIPYVRVKDVLPEGIALDGLTYISQEKHEELFRSRVVPGNVLMTIAGRLGTAAVFPKRLKEGNITGHIAGIELPEDVNPHYLATVINSRFGEFQVKRWGHRTTRPELNLREVGQILIPLPPRPIQDQIAQVMQDAYATRREKLAEAESLLGGIDEYVLGQLEIDTSLIKHEKRFTANVIEFSGGKWRVENHDVRGLDEALQDTSYKQIRLDEVAITVNDRIRPEENFRYIEIGHIDTNSGLIRIEELPLYNGSTAPNNAQRQVKKGDILISTRRPTRGAIAVVPDELDGEICTVFFSIVRLKKGTEVLPDYISAFLRTWVGRLQIQQAITETTYPVISDSDVESLFVLMPPLRIQHQIATEISERRSRAKSLYTEAGIAVAEAKARVERMILGQEEVT